MKGKAMKTYHLSRIFLLFSVAAFLGCESPSSNDVSISGRVVNNSSGEPLSEAVVVITAPAQFQNESKITGADGSFRFSGLNVNEATDISIEARKTGFDRVSITVPATPGRDINVEQPIALIPEDTGGGGDNGGGGVAGPSTGPAQLILTSVPVQAINIAETGDQISAAFTFQVQDSAGRALTISNPARVNFDIISGPGGGEQVTPSSLTTNAAGEVTTALFSGNTAGPVKIQASITREDNGQVIRSTPVLIAIHGGFPDQNHFSITMEPFSIEGYNFNNVRSNVTVIVGDQFSNPVKPGTVVYFSTSGGIIQGSSQTNEDGVASVQLITAAPRPSDNITGSGGRLGYGTVTARTIDQNDNAILATAEFLFSGIPQTPIVTRNGGANPGDGFAIPPNGGVSFEYTVTDQNGNPLPSGTMFKVEVGEGLDATGDVEFELGDFLFPGEGATQFSFSVSDIDEDASDVGGTSIKIIVTTPKGVSASTSIEGTRAKRIKN